MSEGFLIREFRPEKWKAPPETPALRAFRARDRERPVDLEIGCGVGWHPIRYLTEHPSRSLVAIEKTTEKFAKFEKRLGAHPEREGEWAKRLYPIHADAVAWVTKYAEPETFSRIFLLYPNPNLGNVAARWIRMPFFGRLLETLKPEGEIFFRTNEKAYAEEVCVYARKAWGLIVEERREFRREQVSDAGILTHFERKYLDRGQACFEVKLRKMNLGDAERRDTFKHVLASEIMETIAGGA